MYIYGKNPVMDLYKKNRNIIKKFYFEKKKYDEFAKRIDKGIIFPLNSLKGKKIMQENHQGIIAEIEDPKIMDFDFFLSEIKSKKNKTIIILDRINDPQNLGAIMRSASAFGAAGIVSSIHESVGLTPGVIKASAGTWININYTQVNNLSNAISKLKDQGYWIVSTTMNGENSLSEIRDFNEPLAIIFGNEGKGVKKTLISKSDFKISIPMSKNTESLNVSVTAGIILFSIMKG